MPPVPSRVYHATVDYWHDGDTVIVLIDQGFNNFTRQHLRLKDCWCPELSQPGGLDAFHAAQRLAPAGTAIVVETFKPRPETLGRYLARVWVGPVSVIDSLISGGHATPKALGA